jgi:transposase
MSKRKRRVFSEQFKADAAALVTKGGKSVSEVAKQLDLAENSVRRWVEGRTLGSPAGLSLDERAELMELRKRVKRVEMERDILKKATLDSTGQRNVALRQEFEWDTREDRGFRTTKNLIYGGDGRPENRLATSVVRLPRIQAQCMAYSRTEAASLP